MMPDDTMPHIGDKPEWGYMNMYEWNGSCYDDRLPDGRSLEGESPQRWQDCWSHEEWRDIFLGLLQQGTRDNTAVGTELLREVSAQFSDGINTGFYINSYTTKHCPTMEGVLEEWRVGFQRLEELRQQERCKLESSTPINEVQALALKGKSPFAETMRTLNRLSSSY